MELRGQYVYLKELEKAHIPVLRTLAKDERLWEFTKTLLINETYDSQFDRYINIALQDTCDPVYNIGGQKSFVVFRTSDNAIIGMSRYYGIDEKNKRLDIGYTWYIPEVWGKVYNKECKFLMLQYAFEVLKVNRVGFHVAHVNLRSQKAVEKIGGIKEGVLRKHSYQPDGSIRSTVLYSILDEEWPNVKQQLMAKIKKGIV